MNYLEIVNDVMVSLKEPTYGSFDDTTESESHWGLTVVKSRVNRANKEVCAKLSLLTTSESQDSTADTLEYAFPSDASKLLRVYYYDGSKYVALNATNLTELDGKYGDWRTTSGKPSQWSLSYRPAYFYVIDRPDATKTNGLNVDYVQIPSDMSDKDDTPFGELSEFEPYHEIIGNLVAYKFLRDDGDAKKAEMFRRDYRDIYFALREKVEGMETSGVLMMRK